MGCKGELRLYVPAIRQTVPPAVTREFPVSKEQGEALLQVVPDPEGGTKRVLGPWQTAGGLLLGTVKETEAVPRLPEESVARAVKVWEPAGSPLVLKAKLQ